MFLLLITNNFSSDKSINADMVSPSVNGQHEHTLIQHRVMWRTIFTCLSSEQGKSLWKFVRKSDNSKWNNLKHLCKVTTTVESTAEFCTVHHLLLSW